MAIRSACSGRLAQRNKAREILPPPRRRRRLVIEPVRAARRLEGVKAAPRFFADATKKRPTTKDDEVDSPSARLQAKAHAPSL
jgi:hypothetical protein